MRRLKVLLYGDVDLNIMDGSAVWVTSMANMLSRGENVQVDVLLKAKVKNRHLLSEIENIANVRLINPYEQKEIRGSRLQIEDAIGVMENLDKKHQYHCIIVRGFDLVAQLLKTALVQKTIPYITNFTHHVEKISTSEQALLKKIYEMYPYMFVQTEAMKELLQTIIETEGEKFRLLFPMIPDYEEKPSFRNQHNTLVYTGKFAKDWYAEEIIEAMKKLWLQDETIQLNMAGDKFQGELNQKKEEIIKVLQSQKNIQWHEAITRSASLELIKDSDVGISWRSEEIDHDGSVELSTKLLEYGQLGKPVLLRKNKLHQQLFGEDYELFVHSEAEFITKATEILSNGKLYKKVAKKVYEACKPYTFTKSYDRLKETLWSFHPEKIKLLFAGHDLKFIQMAIDYFAHHPNFEVKTDQWSGHHQHHEKTSKECLAWADVIFCEWGLGNAVWYSQHKNQGQKLIVRMHLQERETNYPSQFQLEKIDKIIAISPYIFEEFHKVCRIPREKMTMIYNMIDTATFDLEKTDDHSVMFHLGICGILPKRKRIDKALHVFEMLWEKDARYKLFVKSKMPQELKWLMNRAEEREYYEAVFKRMEHAPWKENVIFVEHGNNMEEWFQEMGYVLSTSDFESFHLAPMEGMAAGSVPLVLHWVGAETIYPSTYIFETEAEMVNYILANPYKKEEESKRKEYPKKHFDKHKIIKEIEGLIESIILN